MAIFKYINKYNWVEDVGCLRALTEQLGLLSSPEAAHL